MLDIFILYFAILSFMGYIYECIAMVLWTGKWDNRGFLFGPIIPIYGFCAVLGTLLFEYVYITYNPLTVFLISMFGSAVVEFVVHYFLEKKFNAIWWDYSKSPFNIQGRICLPASIGFGIAGLIIVYIINPFVFNLIFSIPEWLVDLLAVIFVIIFTVDLTLTLNVLSKLVDKTQDIYKNINKYLDYRLSAITGKSEGVGKYFYAFVDKVEKRIKK